MKFTQIPANAFKNIQLNAGIILSDFTPSSGSFDDDDIIGATSGGVNFTATPNYIDFGDDIDNCPKNTKELKVLDDWSVSMSGTFVSVSTAAAATLVGSCSTATATGVTTITPAADLKTADFSDIWWVGDYADKHGSSDGCFIAIKMKDALNTGGFQIQSSDKAKGTFAFTFTAHYSLSAPETVPFEIYILSSTTSA